MKMGFLIPGRSERGTTRSLSDSFAALQREIDRLLEDSSRSFPSAPAPDSMPNRDLSETGNEIEITAELPGLKWKDA